jgi:hypothetical protein
LYSLPPYFHAADGTRSIAARPVRQSRLYKCASRGQTPPFGGVDKGYKKKSSNISQNIKLAFIPDFPAKFYMPLKW